MLATLSPLPALTVVRRKTTSGASDSWPLSATLTATSSFVALERGTSKDEPALITTRGGMALTARNSASLMPTRLAASAVRMVVGATQTVQLASRPPE